VKAVTIESGRAIAYRLFDIADEVDLTRIGAAASRLTIPRERAQVIVRDAPVSIASGTARIRLGPTSVDAETVARLWNYGSLSLQFHIPLKQGMRWDELIRLAKCAEDDNDIDAVAAAKLKEIHAALLPALIQPHAPAAFEDYIIYLLHAVDGASPAELPERADIPALILGEPDINLAARTRQTIAANTFAYSDADLAVIDWNSALIYDPKGAAEVADVVEFALTHLMEFRYFDDLLDQRMERLYEALELRRPRILRGFHRLSREANALFLEFREYVERVENSVKFVGDPYLGTIFGAAVARFDLRKWEESLERKLAALARISELLQGEVNVVRSHFLEIVIILLIVYEIIAAVV
jgi:hypothetical protein